MFTIMTVIDGACFGNYIFEFLRRAINPTEGIPEDFSEKVTFESFLKEKELS